MEELCINLPEKARTRRRTNQYVIDPDRLEITLREQTDWMVVMLPLTGIVVFVIYRLSLGLPKK